MSGGISKDLCDEIVGFARAGYPPREIRHAMEKRVSVYTIYQALCQARADDPTVPKFNKSVGRPRTAPNIHVDDDVQKRFRREAERRGVTDIQLVREVLTCVVDDNLFAAVLDG